MDGFPLHSVLEESINQEIKNFDSAAIEAERELTHIAVKLGRANSSLVNAQSP